MAVTEIIALFKEWLQCVLSCLAVTLKEGRAFTQGSYTKINF